MNSKGHLIISLIKSLTRIVSAVLTILYSLNNSTTAVIILASGIIISEVLGIIEELVDER